MFALLAGILLSHFFSPVFPFSLDFSSSIGSRKDPFSSGVGSAGRTTSRTYCSRFFTWGELDVVLDKSFECPFQVGSKLADTILYNIDLHHIKVKAQMSCVGDKRLILGFTYKLVYIGRELQWRR